MEKPRFLKSTEERAADDQYDLGKAVAETKVYLGETKELLDDLDTQMNEAVAADDTQTFEILHTSHEEQNTAYAEMGNFVRDIEAARLNLRGEVLAERLYIIANKYKPNAQTNPRMRALVERLQKTRLLRGYLHPQAVASVGQSKKLTGKAAEIWATKKTQLEQQFKESAALEEKLAGKGVLPKET